MKARQNLLLSAGLCLAGAGVPLAFFKGMVSNFGLPKLALLSAAVFLCALGNPRIKRTPLDFPLLAAAISLIVSALFSEDRLQSLLGTYNYFTYGLWPLALCAALYFFACWSEREEGLLRVWVGAGALSGLYALLQRSGIEPFLDSSHLLNGRAISTSGSPVALGAYLAALWPPALHQALAEKKGRISAWLCLGAIGAGLIASISRGSWLSAAVGTLAYLVMTRRLSLKTTGTLLLVAAFSWPFLSHFSPRSHTSESDSARTEIWRAAWRIFLDHPLLGLGPDAFELGFRRYKTADYVRAAGAREFSPHAHDDLLQALSTTGAAGFAAYLWLLFALTGAGSKALGDSRKPWSAALAAGLLSLFVNMKFNPVPVETLGLAALFAGFLCEPGTDRKGGWIGASLICGSALSVLLSAKMLAADREIKLGQTLQVSRPDLALSHFESGIRLDGCETTYRVQVVNLLLAQAARSAQRRELLERAAGHALAALACHPNSPNPHFGLGGIAMMQAQAGMPEKLYIAEQHLDAALRLDPLFLPLLETRLQVALARGDREKVGELSRRIDSLKGPAD